MAEASALNPSFDSRPGRPAAGRPDRAPADSDPAGDSDSAADAQDRQARAAFEQARAGTRSAYGTVVRLYQDRLFNAVFRLVGDHDDAAEVTQEAFARGFEKLSDFRGDSGPYTWLFRIAMNAAVSRLRRASRRKTVSLDALDAMGGGYATSYRGGGGDPRRGRYADSIQGNGPSPSDVAEQSEDHRAVVDALARLDAEHRALLVMRDLEGFDYKQMAEVLDLPLGTLKSRLFRARVALREQLQDHFERPGGPGGPGGGSGGGSGP